MLLQFGRDYIRDFIDNAVPKLEGYDGTVEYLNEHLNPKSDFILFLSIRPMLHYNIYKHKTYVALKHLILIPYFHYTGKLS